MSAATFVCPHCGHTYPFKPALIDKAVRCTTCKNAFRLGADGIAAKVTVPAPAASKPAAPAAPAASPLQPSVIAPITPAPPAAAAPTPSKPAATSPPPAASPAQPSAIAPLTPAAPSQRLSPPTPKAGMTRQQQEARRQMADSLRSAMGSLADEDLDLDEAPTSGAALSGKNGNSKDSDRQDPKRSSERLTKDPKRSSERLAKVRSQSERFKAKDGKQAGKGPAILTNEGEREAAIQRRWLLAFVALIVVALVLGFLATRSSARSSALAEFTRELPANENRYGARIPGIQKRAWLPDVTPFIELPDPRLGRVEEVPPAVLAEALAKLKGLTWVPGAERWIAQGRVEWLNAQLAEDPQGLAKRLEKSGVVQVSRKAMSEQLAAANLSEEGVELVLRLLTSGLSSQLAAHPPTSIHWCTVSGRGGIYVSDPGQGYKYPTADYQGVLLQLNGDNWPGTWKFISLDTVARVK